MENPELLICHACGEDWIRNSNHYDSRLSCPSCGSDFVQIIEESAGPPERERDTFPRSPINPFTDHNPWGRDQDPDQDSPPHPGSAAYNPMDFAFPGYSHHTYRSPDGRFSFSSSTVRGSFPPRQVGGAGTGTGTGTSAYSNPMIPMLQTLQTILGDISDAHGNDHHHHTEQYGNRSPRSEESSRRYSPDPDPTGGIDQHAEFEGLFPRDSHRAQRMSAPVENLADLLGTFHYNSSPRRRTGRPNPRMPVGPDPAMMLDALMRNIGEMGPTGRFGDAVYSREALEEVIAQLGQQDAQGAGPPPAPTTAIQSLPKRKVNKEMLGSDGKAECAICKDTVELDTEVTMLPCEHWFHFDCIEAWLSRHNTCPNCRRSIDPAANSPREGTSENPVVVQDSPEQQQQSPGRRRRRSSPFSRSSRTSARSSFSRSGNNSPAQDANEPSRPRRSSRSEGHHRGGITGWVWSRFGGSGGSGSGSA